MDNVERLHALASALPGAVLVELIDWEGEPTFRVAGHNFLFCDPKGRGISVKLSQAEADALVAGDPAVTPIGSPSDGCQWVRVEVPPDLDDPARWEQIAGWIRASYRNVAPPHLAARVD